MTSDVLTVTDDRPLYPPPTGVPAARHRPGVRYRVRLVGLMAALMLFLAFYLALAAAGLFVLIFALFPPADLIPVPESTAARIGLVVLQLGIAIAAGMFCAYLIKGFLTRRPDDISNWVPVTAAEQPALFAFIDRLCAEIGCAPPARVFLNHDANAAVTAPTSIASLFVAPRNDLLIGLGLANFLDLVEFKALLAHEFGHLTQRELRLTLYVQRLYQVVHNMIYGRDRWDEWMVRAFDTPLVSAFLVPLYMLVEWTRTLLRGLWYLLDLAHRGLSWQMEYSADLVAVGAAGRDAFLRLDQKGGLAQAALRTATVDLALAAEHALFTRDLFYHQRQSAEGITGDLSAPASALHPSSADRRRNVEALAVPSPEDSRPAWLLFQDDARVREEVTRQFYWVCLRADPETVTDPAAVQTFLQQERGAVAIDPRYRGAYDNRYLEVNDIDALIAPAPHISVLTREEMARRLATLYTDELTKHVDERRQRMEEFNHLAAHCRGRASAAKTFTFRGRQYPPGNADALQEQVRAELQEDRTYFESFDRTVLTLHSRLADEQGRSEEYRRRYRVHAVLQQVEARFGAARDRLDGVLRFLYSGQRYGPEQLGGLLVEIGEATELLDAAYADAATVTLPPLEHIAANTPLLALLPPRPATETLATVDAVLAGRQLVQVHNDLRVLVERISRLWVKSLNGILALQEELARSLTSPPTASPGAASGADRTECRHADSPN
jgi:Zn-dependent protease with chaperone function